MMKRHRDAGRTRLIVGRIPSDIKYIKQTIERLAEEVMKPGAKIRTNSFPRGKIEIG
jgi:hypothetical protein